MDTLHPSHPVDSVDLAYSDHLCDNVGLEGPLDRDRVYENPSHLFGCLCHYCSHMSGAAAWWMGIAGNSDREIVDAVEGSRERKKRRHTRTAAVGGSTTIAVV